MPCVFKKVMAISTMDSGNLSYTGTVVLEDKLFSYVNVPFSVHQFAHMTQSVLQFSSTLTKIAQENFEFCFLTLDGIKVMQVHKLILAMYLSDELYKLQTLSMSVKDKNQCFKFLILFINECT